MRHSGFLSGVVTVLAIFLIGRVLLIAAIWIAAFVIALAVLVAVALGRIVILLVSRRREGTPRLETSPPVKALERVESQWKAP